MADEEVSTKAPESDAQEDAGKNPTTEDPVAREGPTMGVRFDDSFMKPLELTRTGTLHER